MTTFRGFILFRLFISSSLKYLHPYDDQMFQHEQRHFYDGRNEISITSAQKLSHYIKHNYFIIFTVLENLLQVISLKTRQLHHSPIF
jgi:hypothetical protein